MSSSVDEIIQAGHDMYVSSASISWTHSLNKLHQHLLQGKLCFRACVRSLALIQSGFIVLLDGGYDHPVLRLFSHTTG